MIASLSSAPLTPAEVSAYHERGVHFPIEVLRPDEVARYRDDAETLDAILTKLSPPAEPGERPVKMNGECHLHFEWAHSLCTHPRVLDAVEQIIGPDIVVHSSTLFLKPPGRSFVSWHQDGHYWELSEPLLVSAWIALRDATVENGCLRVQPGSHLTQLPHGEHRHEDNMLGTGSTVLDGLELDRAVDIVLRAGEMSLHHAHMLHGSNANQSDQNRVGYAIRYVATRVRQGRPHHPVILARGEDRYGHFDVRPPPQVGTIADALPRHVAFSEWLFEADLDEGHGG